MWVPLVALLVGLIIGSMVSVTIPAAYARYTALAILAALDSVVGAVRADLEGTYDALILLSGFFTNAFLAALLSLLGDRLGVELYLAAVVAFGVRLFDNTAVIRRLVLARWRARRRGM